jgi:hypothetical protein
MKCKIGDLIKVDGFLYSSEGDMITNACGLALITWCDPDKDLQTQYIRVSYENMEGYVMKLNCKTIDEKG